MGNGHGGARVGAGRKPSDKPKGGGSVTPFVPQILDGGRHQPTPPPAPGTVNLDGPPSASPPPDFPAELHDAWSRYAQRAIDQGTLTTETMPAFRLLCEADVERVNTKKVLDEQGRTVISVSGDLKSHPLLAHYRQVCRQVEGLMARFKLAAFGKPESKGKQKPTAATANPWAAVAQK